MGLNTSLICCKLLQGRLMTEMSYLNVRVFNCNRVNQPNKGPEHLSRHHCCNLYTSIRQIQYHLITHCSTLFHVISMCVRLCSGLHKWLCARVHHPDCWQCWNRRKIQQKYGLLNCTFMAFCLCGCRLLCSMIWAHHCHPLFAQTAWIVSRWFRYL